MKQRYRITPQGRTPEPSDAEVARYRNPRRLMYNYQRARFLLHRKPLYKDPKAFFALMLIVFLVWFIAEVVEKEQAPVPPPQEQQVP